MHKIKNKKPALVIQSKSVAEVHDVVIQAAEVCAVIVYSDTPKFSPYTVADA